MKPNNNQEKVFSFLNQVFTLFEITSIFGKFVVATEPNQ